MPRAEEAAVVVEALAVEEPVDDLERLVHARDLVAHGGHSIPQGVSFSDSPEPMPRKARPGFCSSSVANACATTAGLWRYTGAVTPVPIGTRSVACPIAPSSTHAWPDSPGSHHGW